MRYYQLPNSHSCAKVTAVIYEKGLRVDAPHFELQHLKSPEYLKVCPTGKVPFLIDGSFNVLESQVIVDYLEEKHPSPSLLHKTIEERTQTRLLCRLHDLNMSPILGALYVPLLAGRIRESKLNDDNSRTQVAKLHIELAKIEQMIQPSPFLVGNMFSAADATFALSIWYAQHCGDQVNDPFTRQRYPKLANWYTMIQAHPSTKRVIDECRAANGIKTPTSKGA